MQTVQSSLYAAPPQDGRLISHDFTDMPDTSTES